MHKFFAILALMSGLLTACAGAPETPTAIPPTSTPIVYPPTWTPIVTPRPPTATPRPPTPPPPPTTPPSPDTLEVIKGFERTTGLRVFHSSLDIVIQDPTGAFAKDFPGVDPAVPLVLLSMEGRQNPDATHWKLRGLFMIFLGQAMDDELEFIGSGNTVYLKGPMPMLGATQDRWYSAPAGTETDLTTNVASGFLTDMSDADAAMPTMRRDVVEQMDGKTCVKYRGEEAESSAFLAAMDKSGSIRSNLDQLEGELERGFLNVWVCDDGYVHKLEMGLTVRNPEQPDQIIGVNLTIRINDMNIIVPIEMPQDAIPLPNPFQIPGYGDPVQEPTDETS